MTNLTVAADAVITAYNRVYKTDRHAVAAVLRAAADHVVPLTKTPWNSTLIPVLTSIESREKLLAIADELEGITYGTYRCDLKPNDSTN